MQAEIASLQQAKENLSSAHKIASSTVDELSARAADVAKSLNRKWYRINPPSNTAIDVQEEEKSFFARGMNGYKIALIVFIGSFAGVMLELLWCFARHGYLESRSGLVWGPFNMLYGVGAASLSIILYRFRNRGKWLSFLGGFVVGSVVEYACSWLQEVLFGSRSWDYSRVPFNINGRVYLNGFLAFGAGATCIKLVVQPWMSDIVRSWPIWLLHAVAGLSFVVVVIDAAITQAGLRSLDSRLAKVSEGIKALKSQQIRQIDTRISEADEQWRETSAKLRGQAEQAYDRFAAGAQQGIRAASRPVADAGELVRRSLNRQQRRLIRTFPKMVSLRDLTITDMIRDLWNRL